MTGSKLYILLYALTKNDKKAFWNFIQSPYFNKKNELVIFYEFLQKQNLTCDKKYVCQNLFSDKKITQKELGYLTSDLMKLLENFLVIEAFKKKDGLQNYYLLSQYQERELNDLFQKKTKQYEKTSEKFRNADYFENQYLSSKIKAHFQSTNLKQRKHDKNIQKSIVSFDNFFIITKLKQYCDIINRKKLITGDYKLTFYEEVISYIENNKLRNEPAVDIYYTILELLDEQTEKHHTSFEHLKFLLKTKSNTLPKNEIHEIYVQIINYCLRKIRNGQTEFTKEALLLYQSAINTGAFLKNNTLSPWSFNNVIKLAIIDKQYEWAKTFIKENNEKLPKDFRNDAINYNLAELLYNEKMFDKAIYHLNLLKHTDFGYSIGSREILAKIYYEKNEEEALLSLIASFTIFLKRNKNIIPNLKKPYLNFCDFLNQILRRNPKKLQNIKEKLKETKVVASKSWLLKTIDKELKKLNLPI